jgi:tRNA A-37 threonylcarbamoyl transferase component Bud32
VSGERWLALQTAHRLPLTPYAFETEMVVTKDARSAFPADPDFPQLGLASDPAAMLDVFRAHLKPAMGRVYHVEACAPFRFRCRQSGTRCVLQYTLRVVEPGTGRRWDQWVTGLLYAQRGEAERLWRELEATNPRADIPERWLMFQPVGFIPELQMIVEVFPYDRRLPQLRRVMNGGLRDLEPLLLARLGPGRWRVTETRIEPTRYRTELGAALAYTIEARHAVTAAGAALRCYLKVYRHDRGEETYRLLRALSDKDRSAAGARPYAVVGPIAYVSELRTLALEEAPGASLQQVLLRNADPVAHTRAVARAVAAFNQDDVAITRPSGLADQLEDLELASALVRWACPEARTEVEEITAAVVRGLEDVPSAPIHGDLKPDHVFLSGDRVIFIDLDSAALGDPVRDPAHLFAYLAGRVGLDSLPAARARFVAETFAEEYFRHVPKLWRDWFPLHCAGALIEVASGIFRRQGREWRARAVAAIAEAQRVLSDGFVR